MNGTATIAPILAELRTQNLTDAKQAAILGILRDEKPPVVPKPVATGGACLCGCGDTTKPKKNYLPGHDQRTKGYVARALAWAGGDEKEKANVKGIAQIPQALVDRMTEDPTFEIHGYDAEVVLWAAGETGTF